MNTSRSLLTLGLSLSLAGESIAAPRTKEVAKEDHDCQLFGITFE